MRKRYRVVIIAAFVAALVVPVGYALSLEPPAPAATHATFVDSPLTALLLSPLAVVPDAGKLLIVGTLMIGASLILRKAS